MNVLSVDYDYFIRASVEAQALFPDGGAEFSIIDDSVVWLSAYAVSMMNDDALISGTSVDDKALMRIRELIKNNLYPWKRGMVADSHRHAYDFIKEYGDGDVTIYNVDFHHDCLMTGNGEVHCGNWVRKLMDEGIAKKVYWVGRKDSVKKDKPKTVSLLSFSDLPASYDLIFVCRSGWWTPPHLDTAFIDYLVNPLLKQDDMTVSFQQDIDKSRYTDDLQNGARTLYDANLQMLSAFRKNHSSGTHGEEEA